MRPVVQCLISECKRFGHDQVRPQGADFETKAVLELGISRNHGGRPGCNEIRPALIGGEQPIDLLEIAVCILPDHFPSAIIQAGLREMDGNRHPCDMDDVRVGKAWR